MTEAFPEATITTQGKRNGNQKKKGSEDDSVQLAPGEGKFPTSLMRDDTFDVDAFPHLHPSGKYGLNHNRPKKLSKQKYFLQRIKINFYRNRRIVLISTVASQLHCGVGGF